MEIQHYLRILNHRRTAVLLTTILTVAVVALGSFRMTPIYTATGLLRVAQPSSDTVSYSDLSYGQRLIETNVQILKSRTFLEETKRRLHLDLETGDLAGMTRIEGIADTELIRLSVDGPDPEQAAAIVNTLADLLIEQGQKIYTGEGKDAREILLDQLAVVEAQLAEDRADFAVAREVSPDATETDSLAIKISAEEQTYSMLLSQYERARVEAAMRANSISVVEPAEVPAVPSKPNLKRNCLLAAVVGLMGGIGLAFLMEALAVTIHSADEVLALTKLDLIGRIPKLRLKNRLRGRERPLATGSNADPAIEAFKALGASVLAHNGRGAPQTVLVSSAEPGAGKSTVVANLGAALAQIGEQVIIVDGDQRHPCLHRVHQLPLAPGLLDSVLDRNALPKCLHASHFPGLLVLTSGSPNVDHTAFWHSDMLSDAVNQLATLADVIIWDTPPILAAADATRLAPLVDLVLLVVAEDQTTARRLNLAIEQLRQVGCEALAIVYNKTKDTDSGYYYGYYRRADPKARSGKNGGGLRANGRATISDWPQDAAKLVAGQAQKHPQQDVN